MSFSWKRGWTRIAVRVRRVVKFVLSPILERGTRYWRISSARLCALACCVVGLFIAVKWPEHSGTVAALIGGGTVALLSRTTKDIE